MSNKFEEALKEAREVYLNEKNKFLDALADFIKDSPCLCEDGAHFHFFIRSRERDRTTDCVSIYGFTFFKSMRDATCNESWFKEDSIKVNLSESVIFNMLKKEYNAEVSKMNEGFLYDVEIPFV